MEKCINNLLELSSEVLPLHQYNPTPPGVDHTHKISAQGRGHIAKSVSPRKDDVTAGEREVWQETPSNKPSSRNRQKHHGKFNASKSNSTKSEKSKVFTGSHGNKGTPQSRQQLKSGEDKPNTTQGQVETAKPVEGGDRERTGRRQQQDSNNFQYQQQVNNNSQHQQVNNSIGQYHHQGNSSQYPGPYRPALLAAPVPHPGARGPITPPGIFRPPQQTLPNMQYYHNERGVQQPPVWSDHVPPWLTPPTYPPPHYNSRPRLIGPGSRPAGRGGMPLRPGGMPLAPNGTPVVPGGMTVGPGGIPVVRSGMNIRPGGPPMAHSGMTIAPGGIAMARNGTAIGPNGLPMAYNGTLVSHDSRVGQQVTHLQEPSIPGLLTDGQGMSDSHKSIPPDHETSEVGWPIETASESGTESRQTSTPHHGTRPGSRLEEVGKEWLNWTDKTSTISEKRLVLVRGLPGSGKTTLARYNTHVMPVFSR